MRKWKKLHKNESLIIHSIFLTRDTYPQWTSQYWYYKFKHQDVDGASMIEVLIWIDKNYTEKMKIMKKNEILFIHPIFLSRDTYDKWISHYGFYKYQHPYFVGTLMIEALISINEKFREKMKNLTSMSIFFIHPIFISRDTSECWIYQY